MTHAKEHQPIWAKRMGEGPDPAALAYCAGRDVVGREAADARLIPWDIWTNRAHVLMLAEGGMIPHADAAKIAQALDALEADYLAGRYQLDPGLEDVHINVETAVTERIGADAGGKIHTARSRNDQSATDMRLWMRDECLNLLSDVHQLISVLLDQAAENRERIIPGYTHAQPAALTTWAHWLTNWAQALIRDADRLLGVYNRIDQCPLGAAAAFGTTWPIDRERTARALGFATVQENTLDCVTSRWEMEADLGQAISFFMNHLSQMGQDLIAFSTPPGDIIRLPDPYTTGSSIMPQKRNPDFAEVTRARAASVHAMTGSLMDVARGSRSGYNRDTQWTKYWIMDLIDEVRGGPQVFAAVLAGCKFNDTRRDTMIRSGFMNAVDVADHLARTRNAPFRTCYGVLAETVRLSYESGALDFTILNERIAEAGLAPPLTESEIKTLADPLACVFERNHLGAPAPDAVQTMINRLRSAQSEILAETSAHRETIESAFAQLKKELTTINP